MKPTNNLLRQLVLGLLAIFVLAGCANINKALDAGNYDEAIVIATKKLRGKTKKKEKFVRALEVGFHKANREDMDAIKRLKKRNNAPSWEKIYYIARNIEKRQNLVKPLLPVVDKEGYKAKFQFVKTDAIIVESEVRAATLIYDEARELLAEAKQGDKLSAREAYAAFDRINKYQRNFKDSRELREEARNLGVVHIAYNVVNQSDSHLPKQVTRELERVGTAQLNSFWKRFHVNPNSNQSIDYKLSMIINHVDVGPSLVKEREFTESKEIEDGWQYVLDRFGNVVKDSLGNDVKTPKFSWVYADVLETNQLKEVCLGADMVIRDLQNNQILDSRKVRSTAVFKHCAATFRGDRRALSNENTQHLNNAPLPFPSDRRMLEDAASLLKPQIERNIDQLILI